MLSGRQQPCKLPALHVGIIQSGVQSVEIWQKNVSEPLKMQINHHRLEEGCSNKGEDVWDVVINMQQPASWFGTAQDGVICVFFF